MLAGLTQEPLNSIERKDPTKHFVSLTNMKETVISTRYFPDTSAKPPEPRF